MKRIQVTAVTRKGKANVSIDVESVYLLGYSGRNQEDVKKHIQELRRIGVPAPEKTPSIFKVGVELLTNANEILVDSDTTSGEIEYVLLPTDEGTYVTVGSDHTDRQLEKTDLQKSKEACPKIIANEAWLYEEVRDHWDDIVFRSSVLKDNVRMTYQEGTLREILNVEKLLEIVGRNRNIALFSGTIQLKNEIIYANAFEMSMYDQKTNRSLHHVYDVKRHFRT